MVPQNVSICQTKYLYHDIVNQNLFYMFSLCFVAMCTDTGRVCGMKDSWRPKGCIHTVTRHNVNIYSGQKVICQLCETDPNFLCFKGQGTSEVVE